MLPNLFSICFSSRWASGPKGQNQESKFLSLPLEIRFLIYDLLISPAQCTGERRPHNPQTLAFDRSGFRNWDHRPPHVWAKYPTKQTSCLLLVCAQLRTEIRETYHPGPLALRILDSVLAHVAAENALCAVVQSRAWLMGALEILRIDIKHWIRIPQASGKPSNCNRVNFARLGEELQALALPRLRKLECVFLENGPLLGWNDLFDDYHALQSALNPSPNPNPALGRESISILSRGRVGKVKIHLVVARQVSIRSMFNNVLSMGGDIYMLNPVMAELDASSFPAAKAGLERWKTSSRGAIFEQVLSFSWRLDQQNYMRPPVLLVSGHEAHGTVIVPVYCD